MDPEAPLCEVRIVLYRGLNNYQYYFGGLLFNYHYGRMGPKTLFYLSSCSRRCRPAHTVQQHYGNSSCISWLLTSWPFAGVTLQPKHQSNPPKTQPWSQENKVLTLEQLPVILHTARLKVNVRILSCMCVLIYVCMCTHTYMVMHVYMIAGVCVRVYVCMYVPMYVCVCTWEA